MRRTMMTHALDQITQDALGAALRRREAALVSAYRMLPRRARVAAAEALTAVGEWMEDTGDRAARWMEDRSWGVATDLRGTGARLRLAEGSGRATMPQAQGATVRRALGMLALMGHAAPEATGHPHPLEGPADALRQVREREGQALSEALDTMHAGVLAGVSREDARAAADRRVCRAHRVLGEPPVPGEECVGSPWCVAANAQDTLTYLEWRWAGGESSESTRTSWRRRGRATFPHSGDPDSSRPSG